MARRIEPFHGDAANAPRFAVSRRFGDSLAVFATDDGKIRRAEVAQLLTICQSQMVIEEPT
jgi:hypothetical protein